MENLSENKKNDYPRMITELREKKLKNIKEKILNIKSSIVKFPEWENYYNDANKMITSPLFTIAEKTEYIKALINANVMCTTKQQKVDFVMLCESLRSMLIELIETQECCKKNR